MLLQDHQREWFTDVIIRQFVEAGDLSRLVLQGRQHQYRYIILLTDTTEYLYTAKTRQHDI